MKKILIIAIIALISSQLFADNKVESTIEEVTVYLKNAKVTRAADASLPAGNSDVILHNITNNVQGQSLRVQVIGDAKLQSAIFRTNYLKDQTLPTKIVHLQDTLEILKYDQSWIKLQIETLQGEERILNNNLKSGKVGAGEHGIPVSAIQDWTAYYRERTLDIKKKKLDLGRDQNKITQLIQKVQRQLNSLNAQRPKPTGEIHLQFNTKTPTKVSIKCTYIVSGVKWLPMYDLGAESTSKPLNLLYKAQIFQTTGFDWNDVKLSVSTANPSQNNSRPILRPRFIDYCVSAVSSYYSDKQELQISNYQMMQTNMAYIPSDTATIDNLRDLGRSGRSTDLPTTTVDLTDPEDLSNDEQVSETFEVELPQTILSNGKQQIVELKEFEIDAKYEHHTVPRLDQGAFLLAKVGSWGKYNLLKGTANIFFKDTYIGQSEINPNTTSDTLLFSLGRDEKITVKRIKPQDMTSTKVIGNKKKEELTYDIIVRNNKSQPITIEILDQIPISKNEDIEIKVVDLGNADYIKDFGKLSWKLNIGPNQTKKVRFSYSLKYPKNKQVTGR